MAITDAKFGKGIGVAAGFDLGAQKPLDSRYTVATIEERDAHVEGNRAYAGMLVYVEADGKTYQYTAEGSWKEFGFNLNDFQGQVVDNLLTEDSTKALSANQGVILKELIDEVNANAGEFDRVAREAVANLSAYVGALPHGTESENVVDYIDDTKATLDARIDEHAETFTQEMGAVHEELEGAIVDEIERATGEEARIEGKLDDYVTSNNQALADEIARATAAEEANANAIAAEAKRADEAEKAIAADLAEEIGRATGKEDELDAAIKAEEARAKKAEEDALAAAKEYADDIKESILGDDLTTTFDTLKAVQDWVDSHEGETVVNLTNAITEEATTRENADKALDEKIDAQVEILEGKIADETEARENAITDALADLATEAATRAEEDGKLSDAIAAEATSREEADTALSNRIKAYEDVAATLATKAEVEAAEGRAAEDATSKANTAEANAIATIKAFYSVGLGLTLSEDGKFAIDRDLVFVLDANDPEPKVEE